MNKSLQIVNLTLCICLSACISTQSNQFDFIKSQFSKKTSTKSWHLTFQKQHSKLVPLFLRNKHITFYGDNNMQIDFNGWDINEIRAVSPTLKIWQARKVSDHTFEVFVNEMLLETRKCSNFEKNQNIYTRKCESKDDTSQDIIKLQLSEIVYLKFYISKQLGYIELIYR